MMERRRAPGGARRRRASGDERRARTGAEGSSRGYAIRRTHMLGECRRFGQRKMGRRYTQKRPRDVPRLSVAQLGFLRAHQGPEHRAGTAGKGGSGRPDLIPPQGRFLPKRADGAERKAPRGGSFRRPFFVRGRAPLAAPARLALSGAGCRSPAWPCPRCARACPARPA